MLDRRNQFHIRAENSPECRHLHVIQGCDFLKWRNQASLTMSACRNTVEPVDSTSGLPVIEDRKGEELRGVQLLKKLSMARRVAGWLEPFPFQ